MKTSHIVSCSFAVYLLAIAADVTARSYARPYSTLVAVSLGIVCGMTAVLLAKHFRSRWNAILVLPLVLLASLLAGPSAIFSMFYGITAIISVLSDLIQGEALTISALRAVPLFALALASIAGFFSQGWAIARGLRDSCLVRSSVSGQP